MWNSRGFEQAKSRVPSDLGRHLLLMKQFDHSGFSSAEMAREADFKPISYVLAAVYFLVDAVFIAVAKPRVGLACQALGAQEIADLDQIA